MRVIVAPDCFGGTLTAVAVADAIADGWSRAVPADLLAQVPVSDGGPGFVDVLGTAGLGRRVPVTVPDPLGRPVPAELLLADEASGASPSSKAPRRPVCICWRRTSWIRCVPAAPASVTCCVPLSTREPPASSSGSVEPR